MHFVVMSLSAGLSRPCLEPVREVVSYGLVIALCSVFAGCHDNSGESRGTSQAGDASHTQAGHATTSVDDGSEAAGGSLHGLGGNSSGGLGTHHETGGDHAGGTSGAPKGGSGGFKIGDTGGRRTGGFTDTENNPGGGAAGSTTRTDCGLLTECDAECVMLETDPNHCGACDVACHVAGGEVCLHGACVNDCGELTNCNGSCVDLAKDYNNCGGCDNSCAPWAGTFCLEGKPALSCGEQTACGFYCVDLTNDPYNCGDCGVECNTSKGELCLAGTCMNDCGQLTGCDGSCVDLDTDPHHCGNCETACPTWVGESCQDGGCTCGALTSCEGTCVDLQTDEHHCGACDVACALSAGCHDGKCGQVGITCRNDLCPSGHVCCWTAHDGESCVDPAKEICYGFEFIECDGPEDCAPGEVCCEDGVGADYGECTTTCGSAILCSADADCDRGSDEPYCCDNGDYAVCRHSCG